jgi:hypothetical protein
MEESQMETSENPYEFRNYDSHMTTTETMLGRFYGKERAKQQENMTDLLNDQYGRDFRDIIKKQE